VALALRPVPTLLESSPSSFVQRLQPPRENAVSARYILGRTRIFVSRWQIGLAALPGLPENLVIARSRGNLARYRQTCHASFRAYRKWADFQFTACL
jgi:hypothetical protein